MPSLPSTPAPSSRHNALRTPLPVVASTALHLPSPALSTTAGLRSGKARFLLSSPRATVQSSLSPTRPNGALPASPLAATTFERRSSSFGILLLISVSNFTCHSVYSVLPSFFPSEAAARGMGDDLVGLTFAMYAAVVFVCAPLAAQLMSVYGQKRVYVAGLILVSLATAAFAATATLDGPAFVTAVLCLRLLQGVGSALEETASYAIVAGLDAERTSEYLGLCELSTGLGYMAGPCLGAVLYTHGGFAAPFVAIGLALVPAAALVGCVLAPDVREDGQEEAAISPLQMLRSPQVCAIVGVCVLANSDYALLEPTLGAHVESQGLTDSAEGIGFLFAVEACAYMLLCWPMGWIASGSLLGPRRVILIGLLLQACGLALIGPSPLLDDALGFLGGGTGQDDDVPPGSSGGGSGSSLGRLQLLASLVALGAGEAAAMTPVLDDMRRSLTHDDVPLHGISEEKVLNALSGAMASAFALGQMLGPLMGASLATRIGLPWTATWAATSLVVGAATLGATGAAGVSKMRALW
jgi:DHA1 family multidrug resistance protein-like MFS transporter